MDFKKLTTLLKPLATATGLALAVAAAPVSADIAWGSTDTFFEDDDFDFLIELEGDTSDGILEIGDVLVAALEFNTANGINITPDPELTGISIIQLLDIVDAEGDGQVNDLVFGAYSGGFDAIAGTTLPDGQGAAGGQALVAFYLDDTPDLSIAAGTITAGTESCQTQAECLVQAGDGDLWMVAGFSGDPDEGWIALNAQRDTNVVLASSATQEFGALNLGLGILTNNTGQNLKLNSIECGVFCAPGGDGMVDVLAGGSIKGGANGGQNGGEWIATSDFDMTLRIPIPGTLLLLGLGLVGMGLSGKRRLS